MISLPLALMVVVAVVFVVPLTISAISSSRHRRRIEGVGADSQHERAAADVVRHAQRRAIIAVVFALVLFTAITAIGFAEPQMLGLPLGIAPGLAVSGGLLLFSASVPPRIPQPAQNSAALSRRYPWSFGPRWAFALPVAVAAAFIAFLVATGITSSPGDDGLYRSISVADANTSSTAGPYPGWFYGLPLIAVTIVLAIATLLALHRVSVTPSLPNAELAELDGRWRSASTLVITKLSTSALLIYFGGTAFIAGNATNNVASRYTATGDTFSVTFRQPEFAIGVSLQLLGAVLAVAGLIFLSAAATAALSLRSTAQSDADAAQIAERT